jgi:hypothetical protein
MSLGVIQDGLIICDRRRDASKRAIQRALGEAEAAGNGASATRYSERHQRKSGESLNHQQLVG